jgi:hypothetical protein
MKMTRTIAAFSVSLIVMSALSLRAQSQASTASQQVQNFQQNMGQQAPIIGLKAGINAPQTYSNEDNDIGSQHILKVIPNPTRWEVVADSRYFYTDNSTLSQRTAANPLTSSSVFVNTISAAYAPTPYKLGDGRFAPNIGGRVQWYNYSGGTLPGNVPVSTIDFNAQTLFIGGKYLLPNNWQLFGEVDYTRIVQQPDYAIEFYHEYVPSFGVQRLLQVSQNSLVSASLLTDYHFGWVNQGNSESQDHLDETFNLAYSWQPATRVVIQPYYRLTYTCYRFDSAGSSSVRNDLLNTFGLSGSYFFTPWLQLQAFANYDVKTSYDESLASPALGGFNPGYHAFDVGLDLTATFRF